MYSSIKYQMLTTFVYKHKYISIYFYLLHVWLVFKKESETRHFHWCSCDTACSEKVNTEATDPSWWQRLLHFNVMRVKIRRQLTWVQLWWQQLKTLHPLWSSQSLLILTHDSVCFVPCLADGPEISADQEGAVPPYPSSASAFPLPGLSLSARHHHPFILFPHSDEFSPFSWIQKPAFILERAGCCVCERGFLWLIHLTGLQERAVNVLMLSERASSVFSCCWFCDQSYGTCLKCQCREADITEHVFVATVLHTNVGLTV